MADFNTLNAAISALTAQVAETETVEASAVALINGFSAEVTKAVTDALTADNAADQGSIDAANQAIATVTARFAAAGSTLGAAVSANTPAAPTPAS